MQSQSWLDLCDENGVAMWEEALGPGTNTADLTNPWYMQNNLAAIQSMATTSINHPSVILHGFFSACSGGGGVGLWENPCSGVNRPASPRRRGP